MGMKPGVVFVGEHIDDEPFMWSGRWHAHWESEDGRDSSQGPEEVSAEEAIAWGREQADVVLIRPGDSDTLYSAGARSPEPQAGDRQSELPCWPDGQELRRRREAGREYLDRSPAAPAIVWRVQAGGDLNSAALALFVSQYATSLRSDEAVVNVLVAPRVAAAASFQCQFTVRAVTIEEARSVAFGVTERAFTAGGDGLSDLPESACSVVGDPEPLNQVVDAAQAG